MSEKIEELERQLDRTLEMQKYIETKHGFLLTILIGVLTVLLEVFKFRFNNIVELIILLVIILSIIIIVSSFFPITNNKDVDNNKNVYFFGSISKMSLDEYIHISNKKSNNDLIIDLQKQIYINSQIVEKKINKFTLVIRLLTIVGLILYICEFNKK